MPGQVTAGSLAVFMTFQFVFRKPRFPVIVIVGDRVFRSFSAKALQGLLKRELEPEVEMLLVDSNWEWFEIAEEINAISPSFVRYAAPKKQEMIDLVNGRSNREEAALVYRPRSLSSRTREEIFQELLAILPAG